MPRRALLLLIAAALLTIVIVFLAVECPGRPEPQAAAPPALGEVLKEMVSRPDLGAASVHLFNVGPDELHIQVVTPLSRYTSFEGRMEEIIRSASARVTRKEQERRDGAVRFLWEIRSGTDEHPTGAVLLFVCPETRSAAAPLSPGGPAAVPLEEGPLAAIIIDDIGYNLDIVRSLAALGRPLTVAVLPDCPHSRESAQLALDDGLEVMLHLPLEALAPGAARAPGTIDTSTPRLEIKRRVAAFLDGLPGVRGVNNHAGSKATEDPAVMLDVLEAVKERGLYFIDSRTSSRTVAYDAARALGIPCASRRVFLDQPAGSDVVKKRLAELFQRARRDGRAVGIGHARTETVEALESGLALADAAGVRLVFASRIVR